MPEETVEMPPGLYWHVHNHNRRLLEWCHDYEERATYIREGKPEDERLLRLRLFNPVVGTLPQEVEAAGRACHETLRTFNEAWHTSLETEGAYGAWRASSEAGLAYTDAWQTYDEALAKHKYAIEALHAQECTDCPWDGNTIFPRE